MNLPGKRILLGTAIAAAALGVGGVAYATSNDPAPEQTYVTVEDGRDCPEKDGTGQGQQGQAQPDQGESAQELA